MHNLKQTLQMLDSDKLIKDILAKSRQKETIVDKNEVFLDALKRNSINKFLEDLKNRSVQNVSDQYKSKVDEYNRATMLYCNKKDKERYLINLVLNI